MVLLDVCMLLNHACSKYLKDITKKWKPLLYKIGMVIYKNRNMISEFWKLELFLSCGF